MHFCRKGLGFCSTVRCFTVACIVIHKMNVAAAEASSENISHNAQPASGELTPRDRPAEADCKNQMDMYAMKNPLFGTQNSVTVSHTGFAHQLADAASMGRPDTGVLSASTS
jgi:hypothetical protein